MRRQEDLHLSQQGLTLVELVIAMAVFALIAVMGLQALSGSLQMRDRLSNMADETETLGLATALLRHDLQSIVPMLFFPPERARPQSAVAAPPPGQSVSMSVSTANPQMAPIGRVNWRLDNTTNTLTRQSWPTLYPARASQAGPEVPVLEHVLEIRLRSFWAVTGWGAGLLPPALAQSTRQVTIDEDSGVTRQDVYSDQLPLAVEVTIVTRDHGEITLLEALQ